MKTHNAENERIKRAYLVLLKEAKSQSEASLDGVAKALSRFEASTNYASFKTFRREQAMAFKRRLSEQVSARTGSPLSKATLYSTLKALQNFFLWLPRQKGYRSRLNFDDAEFFKLSEKETRIATAHRERAVPTLEQIRHVVGTMPASNDVELRDRALVAFAILTGTRDRAIASLKVKHVDVVNGLVEQDAREVATKASKTITTWFFPVGDDFKQIVLDWIDYLFKEKLWGVDDPLFPATEVAQDGSRQFRAVGIARKHWSSATPIRQNFREAFEGAGLPYFNPHSFRKTLVQLAMTRGLNPEEFRAWSQNLGHEQVLTTFTSYGAVAHWRQGEIMQSLASRVQEPNRELALEIVELVNRRFGTQLGGRR